MAAPALRVLAGPVARRILQERGWRPGDVRVMPAAAGGPKGLVLGPLDQFVFGHWLPRSTQVVHLLGASIGAWRMATACVAHRPSEAVAEFQRLAEEYIHQQYESAPGKPPSAAAVTRGFGQKLHEVFGGREAQVLSHPRWRLHIFTSRGQGLLAREHRWRTPMGYAAAFAAKIGRAHV